MDYRVGLVNLGNTCFLNSCIQVLQHIYELHALFDNINKELPDAVLIKEWNELKNLMQKQNGIISPNRFVHMVQQIAHIKQRDLFTGWAQNDMSEFLLFIVDCMHNAISSSLIIDINGTPENELDKRAIICYKFIQSVYKKEYSKVLDLFYGIYVTEIIEPVKKEILSIKPEHFFILDLQLFSRKFSNSEKDTYSDQIFGNIYECIDSFVSPELMDGDNSWFNEETGKKETVNRQVNFWNFPNILVIIFKRFSPDGQKKIQTRIDFPLENLDLSKYVIGYKPKSYVYDLFGVCNHMGGVLGGHYTSFVKNNSGQWNNYNDQMIEQVSNPSEIVSPMAYCLFYRKKNTFS